MTTAHWETVPLAEIAEVRLGRQRSPKRSTGPNMRPYMRAANVTWDGISLHSVLEMDFTPEEFDTYALKRGDLLLAEASGSPSEVGKPAIWNDQVPDCCFQNTLIRVRTNGDLVPFLHLHFRRDALTGRFAQASRGVGIHHLGAKVLSDWSIQLPPLDEQRRIVSEVDKQFSRLDAAVAALERARANLKRYRAAVLKAACEGRLVPTEAELARAEGRDYETGEQLLTRILAERRARWEADQLAKMRAKGKEPKDDRWKAKYSEASLPPTNALSNLPDGWTWATWDQLSPRVTVGHVGPMKHRYVETGVPFLRSQNVRENRFSDEGLLSIPPDFHEELGKSKLGPGDLVVVRSGSVGTTCVIPDFLQEANCSDLVIVKRPFSLEPRFGAYYMNSLAKSLVKKGTVGVALTHFNTASVAAMPVPLPPMAEQLRIADECERQLSTIDELENEVLANLRRAQRLRQSILKRAFEGKLVPQDPNDEPASALLERIRAPHAAQTPVRRRRNARATAAS